jgi:hypothetical protein
MSPELAEALRSLVGAQVTGIGRTEHVMEIGFDRDGMRLTVSCPLRVVRGERILVGEADLNHPEDRDRNPQEAYRAGTTMYDRNARRLTAMFAESEVRVLTAEVDPAGAVRIEAGDQFRFEVLPTSANRRLEAWRLTDAAGTTHVYPTSR